jgi:hypothetical protein
MVACLVESAAVGTWAVAATVVASMIVEVEAEVETRTWRDGMIDGDRVVRRQCAGGAGRMRRRESSLRESTLARDRRGDAFELYWEAVLLGVVVGRIGMALKVGIVGGWERHLA